MNTATYDTGADYRTAAPAAPGIDDSHTATRPAMEPLYEELFNPLYEWQHEYTADSPLLVDMADEEFALGFDIKITPGGQPKIIEYHVNNQFSTEGFKQTDFGNINGLRTHGRSRGFTDFLEEHTRKDRMHEALDRYTADLDPDGDELGPDDKIVTKPTDKNRGRGVSVHRAGNAPGTGDRFLLSDTQAERFVEGRPVSYMGEQYDACMRYVMNGTIRDGELTLTDLGGYWRTAAKPLTDPNATLTEKHVANLAQGGNAVEAEPYEILMAAQTAANATRDLFTQWTTDTFLDTLEYETGTEQK